MKKIFSKDMKQPWKCGREGGCSWCHSGMGFISTWSFLCYYCFCITSVA